MKKLCMLFVFCFAYAAQADILSDAIMASNIQEVRRLLAQNIIDGKNIIKYLDIAEQTIRLRRDNSIIYKYQFSIPQDKRVTSNAILGISAGLFLLSLVTVSYEPEMNSLCNRLHIPNKIPLALGVSATRIGVLFFAYGLAYKLYHTKFEYTCYAYRNAVLIKELLYETLNSQTALL
jgi:hypothetical protein